MGFGYKPLTASSGVPVQLSFDGNPEYLGGSITIDWNTIAANAAPVVLAADELTVAAGQKFLQLGQFMCMITGGANATVTLTNTPTGGTFTVTVSVGGVAATTTALAYNVSTTNLATAINALSNVGSGATVTGTAGTNYTIALPSSIGASAVTASGALLTGAGAQPAANVTTNDATPGGYGPYDPNATDGRQTPVIGKCGFMNETILQNGVLGITVFNTDNTNLVVGGRVWLARLLQVGSGSASLAGGPTFATLTAALPRLMPV
jgi:hypothetical protein